MVGMAEEKFLGECYFDFGCVTSGKDVFWQARAFGS